VLIAGGLDPVAIDASVGDSIVVAIGGEGARSVRAAKIVPAQRHLAVVRTEPAQGRENVPIDAQVKIVFSEPLDPSSMSEAGILQNALTPVSRVVEVSPSALTASMKPSAPLLTHTEYTIVLGAGVHGADGVGLDSAVAVGFRTILIVPVEDLPSIPPSTLVYAQALMPGQLNGALSRYLLDENGAFRLQFMQDTLSVFEYRGSYSRLGASIAFEFFDANLAGPWRATGTLRGDSLFVVYNAVAGLAGFEDGVYVLESGNPPVLPPTPSTIDNLAFTRGGDIYVIHADGRGLRQVTSGLGEDYEAAWSPDGSRIAFTRYRHDRGHPSWGEAAVYVIGADGGGLVRLSAHGDSTYDAHPTWSPDGTRIAFYSRREHAAGSLHANDSEIWVMNADGTSPVRLTHQSSLAFHPAWSPDGSRIAYRAANVAAETFSIYVMQANGANPTAIAGGDNVYAPAWSPDGFRILTRTARCLQWTNPGPDPEIGPDCAQWQGPYLSVVNADGSDPALLGNYLLHGDDELGTPATWSPDGQCIAFTQTGCLYPQASWNCSLPSHIEILRRSDGTVLRVTEGSSPSWRW
jgi:Tol biopolymer transport system component